MKKHNNWNFKDEEDTIFQKVIYTIFGAAIALSVVILGIIFLSFGGY